MNHKTGRLLTNVAQKIAGPSKFVIFDSKKTHMIKDRQGIVIGSAQSYDLVNKHTETFSRIKKEWAGMNDNQKKQKRAEYKRLLSK